MLRAALEDEMVAALPLLHFLPSPLPAPQQAAKPEDGKRGQAPATCDYECPLYKTSARQGVVSTTGQVRSRAGRACFSGCASFLLSLDLHARCCEALVVPASSECHEARVRRARL